VCAELDERSPGYLERQGLRVFAHPDGAVGVLPIERLTTSLLARSGADQSPVRITARHEIPVGQLARMIGMAHGVEVTPVADRRLLNPVDRMLADRVGASADVLTRPARLATARGHFADPGLDEPAVRELVRAQHERWSAGARLAEAQAEELARHPETVITAADGARLPYTALGSVGPPLLVVNALGQGAAFWHRLVSRLMPRRVLIWEPRGVYEDGGRPLTLEDHVGDAQAILDHAGAASCHVLAWCTGPRVAVELHRRRPGTVRSMVFLNGSFKQLGHGEELDTPYERNLEFLCRTLEQDPRLAGRLLGIFNADQPADSPEDADPETIGTEALRRVSTLLRTEVRRPFTDPATLARYAAQLLDMWSRDPLTDAAQVRIPVLLVGAEYDEIVSPERIAAAAKTFPNACFATISGATHYALHDRAEEIGAMINDFFHDAGCG
jgi:pimeloyl-ACP methyl ester carboxylesterase